MVRVARPRQGFRKFGELSWNEQLLFSEAFFFHLTTGLILKVIPFNRIPRVFSSPQIKAVTQEKSRTHSVGEEPQTPARSAGMAVGRPRSGEIELVKTAIGRASRVSPWRNKCLVSSLAGRCMLRKRKIESELSLGMAKDNEGRPIAHAWLKSGDVELVERSGNYIVLYTF